MPSHVLELELSEQTLPQKGLDKFQHVYVLLRYKGQPVGSVRVRCSGGVLQPAEVHRAILADPWLRYRLTEKTLREWLMKHAPTSTVPLPTSTIAICTRDRATMLKHCLDSILKLKIQSTEVIILDNAPSDDSTLQLVRKYPFRYIKEEQAGLNWARNCAAKAAQGEVLIFTDDDAIVDENWLTAILQHFENPRIGAVTGLIAPLELETEAQEIFETHGGFNRGFESRIFEVFNMPPTEAGSIGSGVNMAFRTSLTRALGLFEAEMDRGSKARAGGDLYAFYKLLQRGYLIRYEPDAIVWHRHRKEMREVLETLRDYNVGLSAFWSRCFFKHGDYAAIYTATKWLFQHHFHQAIQSIGNRNNSIPIRFILPQIFGFFFGPFAYLASLKEENNRSWKGEFSQQ